MKNEELTSLLYDGIFYPSISLQVYICNMSNLYILFLLISPDVNEFEITVTGQLVLANGDDSSIGRCREP